MVSGNPCHHSVQNLFYDLLSENVEIVMGTTTFLPVDLYRWETWSLTFRRANGPQVPGENNAETNMDETALGRAS
jgi:hypothetical protein